MLCTFMRNKHLTQNIKLLPYKTAIHPILICGLKIWLSAEELRNWAKRSEKIYRQPLSKSYKRFSNGYSYEIWAVGPFCRFVLSLQKKFLEKFATQDGALTNDTFHSETGLVWMHLLNISVYPVQRNWQQDRLIYNIIYKNPPPVPIATLLPILHIFL